MSLDSPSLQTTQKREPPSGPPFAIAAADNGLSVDPVSGKIVLGQSANTVGGLAQLLNSRFIPMNGLIIGFTGQDDGLGNLDSIFLENGGIISIRRNSSVTTGPSINFLDYDDGSQANFTYTDLEWRMSLNGNPNVPLTIEVGSFLMKAADDTGVVPFEFSLPAYISGLGGPIGMQVLQTLNNAAGVPVIWQWDITDAASNALTKLLQMNVNTIDVFHVDKTGGLQTGDPGSGPGIWKLGTVVAGAVAPDAANYVEVNIGGTIIKLIKAA